MDANPRTHRLLGALVELLGGVAIVVAGAVVATVASDRLGSPTSEAAVAVVVAAVAVTGLAWIRRFDSNTEPAWSGSLAGLGGAVGFLAFEFLVGAYAPVGAGLGAGLFVVAGVLCSRRALSRTD